MKNFLSQLHICSSLCCSLFYSLMQSLHVQLSVSDPHTNAPKWRQYDRSLTSSTKPSCHIISPVSSLMLSRCDASTQLIAMSTLERNGPFPKRPSWNMWFLSWQRWHHHGKKMYEPHLEIVARLLAQICRRLPRTGKISSGEQFGIHTDHLLLASWKYYMSLTARPNALEAQMVGFHFILSLWV